MRLLWKITGKPHSGSRTHKSAWLCVHQSVLDAGADPEGVHGYRGRLEAPGAEAPRSSSEGASLVERPGRDDRGAEGADGDGMWEEGVSIPTKGRVWGGSCAPTQKFAIFELKKASFGAFWD